MIERFVIAGLSMVLAMPCFGAEETRPKQAKARKAGAAASAPGESDSFRGARSEVYKKVGGVELKLHIYLPPDHKSPSQDPENRPAGSPPSARSAFGETRRGELDAASRSHTGLGKGSEPTDKRPAIVFFFGGGWLSGSAGQFVPQCQYLASRGMVAATADYRVYTRHQAMVADCTADAQAAVRWMREHARELGVDPERIAAGGGSAGGHLAAATGTLKDFTGDKDTSVGFRPNAMVLFNPAIDLTPDEAKAGEERNRHLNLMARLGAKPEELSPMDHVRAGLPPTIIFHGRSDSLIPFAKIEEFAKAMNAAGNRCEVVGFEGQGHGFFNPGKSGDRYFIETLRRADQFLASLGYLKGEPTIGKDTRERPDSRPH